MSTNTIVRLKITLDHVKPEVLRRVEVPVDITLDRLHLTIQAAMGWTNSHLYELRCGSFSWSKPYPEADWEGDFLDARKARLREILGGIAKDRFSYIYDFGDDWEHSIGVEAVANPEAGVLYPRLIEVSGRCPPEDCGGPLGYAEFRDAIKDPRHERHADMLEWIGDGYDPDADNADWLIGDVASLAKTWCRKPASGAESLADVNRCPGPGPGGPARDGSGVRRQSHGSCKTTATVLYGASVQRGIP